MQDWESGQEARVKGTGIMEKDEGGVDWWGQRLKERWYHEAPRSRGLAKQLQDTTKQKQPSSK